MSARTSFKQKAKQARRLLQRKAASELHENAWAQFDWILRQRTTIFTVIYAVYKVILSISGDWISKKQMLLDAIDD